MDLLDSAAELLHTDTDGPWENPFAARTRRKKHARTGSQQATEVREVESNVEADRSTPGDDRTFGDLRRWITTREERFRHSHWWNRRLKIFSGMEAAGYARGRLERFANCGAWATAVTDVDTGEVWSRSSCCHDRFCSPCTRSRALLIADNLAKKIGDAPGEYVHIVLTLKHTTQPLPKQVDRLYRSFRNLRATKLFRNHVGGGSAFLQIHVAESDDLWHVHFHLLAQSRWIDQAALARTWKKITGDSDNVHVSRVAGAKKAVREVSRYAASPVDKDTINDPNKLAELMRAIHGRRLCFTFGNWRSYKLTLRPPPDPEQRLEILGRVDDLVRRAEAGEEHAKHIITIILGRSHPKTGPPDLFTDKWRLE